MSDENEVRAEQHDAETLARYREQDREIRALLKSVGLRSVVEEGCVKYPLIDHIRQMVEWQKQIEKVRNALVKELKRRGIAESEMRALIAQEPPAVNIPEA